MTWLILGLLLFALIIVCVGDHEISANEESARISAMNALTASQAAMTAAIATTVIIL